ncbi:MAG: radical SAM protein [Desulfobaccales bacterium]
MTVREMVRLALKGGPGFIQIAVTNACNAHCRFCSFPQVPVSDWCMADPARLARGLAAMARGGLKYVALTGGEPLLYPDLFFCLERAQTLGLETILVTNGAILTAARIESLARLGVRTLIISIDAASAEVHDRHRGLPGLVAHVQDMLPLIRRAGMQAVASVTLSRLIDDLDALVRFVHQLGFSRLTFSYPLTSLNSSYLSYAENSLVNFTPEELDRLFARVIDLKGRAPVIILNPRLSLEDVRRQLQGRASRFPCLAGFKYFFADWDLKVYRCHFLPDVLGSLEEIDRISPIRDGCTACSVDCYRDPSVLQYAAVSMADALAAWRRGEVGQGLKSLLNRNNFLSLTALREGLHWVE